MGRSQKKRNIGLWIVGILAVVVIGVSVWQIVKLVTAKPETPPETTPSTSSEALPTGETSVTETTGETVPAELSMPCELLPNGVTLESVFRYSGLNPDCDDENGDEIGGIILKNQSDQQINTLDLEVQTSENEILHFHVENLPVGETAWAFERDNKRFPSDDYVTNAVAYADFVEGPAILEGVTWESDYTEVTLTNNSGKDLTNLTVVCRCQLEDASFGGIAYEYTLDSLANGESAVISADDCYLGDAAVVRIVAGE